MNSKFVNKTEGEVFVSTCSKFLADYKTHCSEVFPDILRTFFKEVSEFKNEIRDYVTDDCIRVQIDLNRLKVIEQLGHSNMEILLGAAVAKFHNEFITRADADVVRHTLSIQKATQSAVKEVKEAESRLSAAKKIVAFKSIIQSTLRVYQPLPRLSIENLSLFRLETSYFTCFVNVETYELICDIRDFFGFLSIAQTLAFVVLHHDRSGEPISPVETILNDAIHLLTSLHTMTDQDFLEEVLWLSKSYFLTQLDEFKNDRNQRSRFNITLEDYDKTFGKKPTRDLIEEKLALYKANGFTCKAMKPKAPLDREKFLTELEPIIECLRGTVSFEVRRNCVGNYRRILSSTVSRMQGTDDFSELFVGFDKNPSGKLKSIYLVESIAKKVEEFRSLYGIRNLNTALHIIVDPERTFW